MCCVLCCVFVLCGLWFVLGCVVLFVLFVCVCRVLCVCCVRFVFYGVLCVGVSLLRVGCLSSAFCVFGVLCFVFCVLCCVLCFVCCAVCCVL